MKRSLALALTYSGYRCSQLGKFDETSKTQSQRVDQENLQNRQRR